MQSMLYALRTRYLPSALVWTRQEMLGGDDSCLGPKGGSSKETPFQEINVITLGYQEPENVKICSLKQAFDKRFSQMGPNLI